MVLADVSRGVPLDDDRRWTGQRWPLLRQIADAREVLFALFLTTSKWQTLPILVAGQNSQRGDEWWAISAAVLIAIVPMVIMAALLSRLMRSGLLLGAVK